MRSSFQEVSGTIPIEDVSAEDESDKHAVRNMLAAAERYVTQFCGHSEITERFAGVAIPGVIGLFLFRFQPPITGGDEWLWVVEGDLPSAYFVVDEAPTSALALEVYCELMTEWAEAVLSGNNLENVFPVDAMPTGEHAELLLKRIRFLRENIIPPLRRT
jgi:hypothetical protein